MKRNTPAPYALIFPVDVRNALIQAALLRDTARIDQITDVLAHRGLVRQRSDESKPWSRS